MRITKNLTRKVKVLDETRFVSVNTGYKSQEVRISLNDYSLVMSAVELDETIVRLQWAAQQLEEKR